MWSFFGWVLMLLLAGALLAVASVMAAVRVFAGPRSKRGPEPVSPERRPGVPRRAREIGSRLLAGVKAWLPARCAVRREPEPEDHGGGGDHPTWRERIERQGT